MAYSYCLIHKKTGRLYYGVRFKVGCDGSDLGTTYFSSSKIVKEIIKHEGIDSFDYHVRVVAKTKDYILRLEERVLRHFDVINNDRWLNRGYITSRMVRCKADHSIETKRKIGASNSKPFVLYNQDNERIEGTNLQEFARDNGYSAGNLCMVITGKSLSAYGLTREPNTRICQRGSRKPFEFYNESGEHCSVGNLKEYCETNDLTYHRLLGFLGGRLPSYRNFKRV